MFDYHMHTTVSYDGHGLPQEMADAAVTAGLKEICFTDHLDYMIRNPRAETSFRVEDYSRAYDGLTAPGLLIRRGVEVGLTPWNADEIKAEVLADKIILGDMQGHTAEWKINGEEVTLGVAKNSF